MICRDLQHKLYEDLLIYVDQPHSFTVKQVTKSYPYWLWPIEKCWLDAPYTNTAIKNGKKKFSLPVAGAYHKYGMNVKLYKWTNV